MTLITTQQALAFLNRVAKTKLSTLDAFLLEGLNTALMAQIKFDILEESDEDEVILIDGVGSDTVWCPNIPIVSVTSIKFVRIDGTKLEFTLEGSPYPQVSFDPSNGSIKLICNIDSINTSAFEDIYTGTSLATGGLARFPVRKNCVEVTGKFGISDQKSLLQYILQLMVLKHYSLTDPSNFQVDLAEEKFANYQYKLRSTGLADNNQMFTLDRYIQNLIDSLPRSTCEIIGSI